MSKSVTFSEPDPFLEASAMEEAAAEAGFEVMPRAEGPVVRQPEDLSRLVGREHRRLRIDPSELIITEAPLLNEAERADAQSALIADQVFASLDWPALYLGRDFAAGEEKVVRFERTALVLMGIKFGWALEQAARIAAAAKERAGLEQIEIVLDLASTVTPEEHLFIGLELQRREVRAFDLVLPWGGRWEPAVDWIGDAEALEASLMAHRATASQNGWRLSFDHVEQKFAALPILSAQGGNHLHLNIDGLGWLEATRVVARHEPNLFRELLRAAQDRFVFDKPNAEFSTTEDDIRSLPDVPDSELERFFVEDFRGRQLLRFTAPSLLHHEELGRTFRAVIERNRQLHHELTKAEARRHFAPWQNAVG